MLRARTASTIAVLPPTWRYTVAREHPASRATASRFNRSNPWRAICLAATDTMRSAATVCRSDPCSQSAYGDIVDQIYRKLRQIKLKFSEFPQVAGLP
ncbi:hypothetical protein MA5S0921_1609 [Mycobacteroides abscessus 5S-0921]|nr:hypothetical protein MA5S0304_0880 [Mycobacteroides abscessus 5S-0304]EIU17217.1 hypothetical protein MA5S0421_1131 [Mycobacteroides abscessus 5S-0421]EIU33155.1 hypothetical protein MA5S0817_0909 [Mycobacteroides abscessus 5S-0817]EIU42693.1 hypothetical protein MA5S1215_1195 [Mycobacteroides abscessus 5S-1215]EIU97320.1 hypothetical protein MA5S0921_1609 [Mycobacteroides abscessus 5S-0921]